MFCPVFFCEHIKQVNGEMQHFETGSLTLGGHANHKAHIFNLILFYPPYIPINSPQFLLLINTFGILLTHQPTCFTCGRKQEHLAETCTVIGRGCKIHKDCTGGLNRGHSSTSCATALCIFWEILFSQYTKSRLTLLTSWYCSSI